MKNVLSICLFALAAIGSAQFSRADVSLPNFFSDHMVLQQDATIKVWGWTDAGDEVTVSLGESSAPTTADAAGKWKVELPPMKASKASHKMVVKGSHNSVEFNDILIGEVWICSGQSNMEWVVANSLNPKEEIAAAKFPMIRHIKVKRVPSSQPRDNVESDKKWEVCSPDTAGRFTACGYFMARKLYRDLDIPIGLINSSWGGTRVEPWTPPVGFERVDALKSIYQSVVGRTPGSESYKASMSKYISDTEQWLAKAKNALGPGEAISTPPQFPGSLTPFKSHQDPTMLYNGMIHAIVGLPFRGAIWYQGESNHNEGMMYFEKKKALINGWRELWGQGEFPFYFVQIAPFQYGKEDPAILAKFWEAQEKVTTLPNVEMVVTNDITTLNDIHPPNKQDVGLRLANLALKYTYAKEGIVARSPRFESLEVQGNQLKLNFAEAGGGLKTRDGQAPNLFEIIGKGSNGFQIASAKIVGDAVLLTSENVDSPTAFRFAWNKLAEPNLTGGTGLPVGACRGGEIPAFLDTVPLGDYSLLYEMDLAKLGGRINYDRDNSNSIGAFDRVGYLVELESGEYGDQKVFVSMDAFTDDAKKVAIPVFGSGALFQQKVSGVEVFSSTDIVKAGKIGTGNIEFWPHNYGQANTARLPGASPSKYDFGDQYSEMNTPGYGCMQVHNFAAKQTIFAINNWKNGKNADIGIGNHNGQHPDWTFASNGQKYSAKRLKVYVRTK